MKRMVRVLGLAALLAILLTGAAGAAGDLTEEGAIESELGFLQGNEGETIIEVGPLPEWSDGLQNVFPDATLLDSDWQGQCYGDQLMGLSKTLYDELEQAFSTGSIPYKDVQYNGEATTRYSAAFEKEIAQVMLPNVTPEEARKSANELREQYGPLVNAVWWAFTYDHPEYFWIRTRGGGGASWSMSGEGVGGGKYNYTVHIIASITYNVAPGYESEEQRRVEQQNIDRSIQSILQESEGMPTVARLAYFDSWLATHNVYNKIAAENSTSYISTDYNPWSVVGGLVDGNSPVCEGYAKSFQLLCSRIGVDCVVISGSNHMWNAVKVDGIWYDMDCTWNDQGIYSIRSYFLKGIFSDSGHRVGMGFATPIPEIADSDYFHSTAMWVLGPQAVTGYTDKASSGTYWMALYNNHHRLLAIAPCFTFEWTNSSSRTIAPEFTPSVVQNAAYGKVFQLTDQWTVANNAAAQEINR